MGTAKNYKFKINWRYAIGEFLIVVFGIIVAFQVDAWKVKRDNNILLTEYLNDLETSLQIDSLFYGNAKNYFDVLNRNIESTQIYFKAKNYNLSKTAQKSIRDLSDWYRIYISNAAFEDMKNSGRLSLIQNKNIRHNLISYYQYIDFIKILEDQLTESLIRMEEEALNYLDFIETQSMQIPKEKVLIINNYLIQKQQYIRSYLGHRRGCQVINNNLRKLIAEEIKTLE